MTRRAWVLLALLGLAGIPLGGALWVRSLFHDPWARRFVPGARTALWVGNSQSFVNGVPGLVAQLAEAAGEAPFAYEPVMAGGARLEDHLARGAFDAALALRPYDHVVLQEQSETSARPLEWTKYRPSAAAMGRAASDAGAQVWLVQFWGFRDGDRRAYPDDTDAAMRARSRGNAFAIAEEARARVIPVGRVWGVVRAARPDLALWAEDGIHTSPAGAYVSACTHFASLYDRPVSGVPFYADLDPDDARAIQEATDRLLGGEVPE